jgi:acetyl-CoA carboxylase carboxyltransferase component
MPEVRNIARRRQMAQALGGEEAVKRQHNAGKLTARERIDLLFDEGSFTELAPLTGKAAYDDNHELTAVTPANAIIGKGMVDKRRAIVSADDFTIRGGSSDATISEKWIWAERYAYEMRMPLVRLVDSAGGSVKLLEKAGATKIPGYPTWPTAKMMGVVPVVGVALGACAGLGAVKVAAAHFSVMVKGTSQVFAAGPPVVNAGVNQKVTKEELGGAEVHARGSGVVDNEAESEADAIEQTRRFLSYMPANVYKMPPCVLPEDDPQRREEELIGAIPREKRRVYNIRKILKAVLDRDSFFELGRYNGRSVITGLARMNGRPVGIIANDPFFYGGAMTLHAAQKMEGFVDLCDTFHLPVINFVDQPGVMIGVDAEKAGTMRAAIRCLAAIEQSTVPWAAIIIRRLFGVAGSSYGRFQDIDVRYAWPSAQWGSIPLEGGIAAAYRRELEAASDPAARLAELEDQYRHLTSPFLTAERFGVTDVIDPRETRPILCDWVEEAYALLPSQLGPVARGLRR